jgi:group I intron endonuclease
MRVANLALQADLCYNKGTHIVVSGGAVNTPDRIRLYRRHIMDTLPPHADNGNLIPNASGIYKITCTTNKRIYIGSAVSLRKRKSEHFSYLQQNKHINPHLQNAWNKYGEQAFTFEILEYVLPMSLTAREQYWLNKLKPFGNKGFNIARDTVATHLGRKHTPEHTEKIRQSNLGRKQTPKARENMRQAHLGKKLSSEHIENARQAQIGHEVSLEAREKSRQAQIGKKKSPETIEKMRQAKLGKKRTPEQIENSRQSHIGLKRSPETRARMSAAQIGHAVSPEQRQNIRQTLLSRNKEKRSNKYGQIS